MAWVTKDSVEQYDHTPEPPKEYTKKEKASNWWHYNKWIVLGSVIAVVAVVWIAHDVIFQVGPDYKIAYVGLSDLPLDTASALETALTAFCDDRNGDGQVVVELSQYNIDFDENSNNTDAYSQMSGVTRLSADLSGSEGPYIFILQDPEGFTAYTGALQYLDGTMPNEDNPETDDWHQMVYHWKDCPVLSGLDLGEYHGLTVMDDQVGPNQDVLADLYIGHRAAFSDEVEEGFAKDQALWEVLSAGAVSTVTEDE